MKAAGLHQDSLNVQIQPACETAKFSLHAIQPGCCNDRNRESIRGPVSVDPDVSESLNRVDGPGNTSAMLPRRHFRPMLVYLIDQTS